MQTIAEDLKNVTKYKYRYLAEILLDSRYNYLNKKSTWLPLQLP
jgi:hypothetical protein